MSRNQKLSLLLLAALLPLGCRTKVESRNRFEENRFPSRVLWVWERPEDLLFLDPQQFARVHRSYILNVNQVTRIEPYEKENHLAILRTGAKVPVSKTGYPKLKTALGL